MHYYKSPTGDVWAYPEGTTEAQRVDGLVPMTPDEIALHLNPHQSLNDLADAAIAAVNAVYAEHMGAIANAYPKSERESWHIQLAEAKDLMTMGDSAVTPWMDQCAHQRGLTRLELAERIVAKDTAYRQVSGFFSGLRQWHEDCIDLLLQLGEEARAELQDYDHLQGWVPAE